MLISGLLIAELSINRMGETGRYGVGLLELYKSNLGEKLGWVGSGAYFFLHYAVMVAYMAQGGLIWEQCFKISV
jgi:tyrosine-specific transport protein